MKPNTVLYFYIKIVKEEEIANSSKGAENEIKQRVLDLRIMLEEEKRRRIEIAGEMASQYKRLQENLDMKLTNLTNTSNQLMSDIEARNETLEKLRKDRDNMAQEKDSIIEAHKKSMTEMSDQFLDMLKDTLTKIKSRIDSASSEFEKTNEGSLKKKLEEFTIAKS